MIELRSVTKAYGDGLVAVDDLSMQIDAGELCVLVGPSGCGKTTTLKMINRLIEPTSGEIRVNDVDVSSIDVVQLRRQIGYVMQQGGLFPHLRVADNVATVPRLLGWPKATVAARVEELLDLVGLEPERYLRRFPHELSGGERQRVGVARALGGDPPVLLMDEPFGAVDPVTRKRLQEEFLELQERVKKTVVFVTHDIEEALLLGSRIAIMHRGGVLEQYASPEAILANPASPFVAEFVGADRDLQRLGFVNLAREDLERVPALSREEARAALSSRELGLFVVVDGEGRPLGVVGDGAGVGPDGLDAVLAEEHPTLPIGTSLRHALSTMLATSEEHLVVTEDGAYAGLVSLEALHRATRRSLGAARQDEPE